MAKVVSMEGIGAQYVTFLTEETQDAVGKVCTLSGNETVKVSSDGDKFCGVIVSVKDGVACVQVAGCCQVPYTGTALAVGYANLAAASGGVSTNSAGREVLIYHVDSTEKTVGMML